MACTAMSQRDSYRPLSENERRILDKLMTLDFIGRAELMQQLSGLLVKEKGIDREGSIEFEVRSTIRAPADGMVVEGRCPGITTSKESPAEINVLLHVRDGKLWLLEVYKDDGSNILQRPNPEKFALFSPIPRNKK